MIETPVPSTWSWLLSPAIRFSTTSPEPWSNVAWRAFTGIEVAPLAAPAPVTVNVSSLGLPNPTEMRVPPAMANARALVAIDVMLVPLVKPPPRVVVPARSWPTNA